MRDPEFVALRNRFLLGVVATLIIIIPLLVFFINKYGDSKSSVIKAIEKKEDIVVLVSNKECDFCLNVEAVLKDNNIEYIIFDKVKEDKYEEILRKLEFSDNYVTVPGIFTLKKGKLDLTAMNLESTDDVLEFVDFYEDGVLDSEILRN